MMTRNIALVGAGPSSLYTLQHLLESGMRGHVVIFESGSDAGSGTPYDRAYNDPAMLSNIASIELPPVGQTLLEWSLALPPARKAELHIDGIDLHERTFLPRIALGAYFADRLEWLIARAPSCGWTVELKTGCLVVDVMAQRASATVKYTDRAGDLHLADFANVVIATGHFAKAPDGHCWPTTPDDEPLYRQVGAGGLAGKRIGVIGTSLSAIDVAVAIAKEAGTFSEVDGKVVYRVAPGHSAPAITLMSRRGVLPEADYYCPIPYEPLAVMTPAAVTSVRRGPRKGRLDRLFRLFRTELAQADPAYAAEIGLDALDADSFPAAYFAARMRCDALDWARRDLAEVTRNASAKRTVPWKYAILRMHEPMGDMVRSFDEDDRARFARGMAPVFIDNYAAAPPLSIQRILALYDAGVLSVVRLGEDYTSTVHDGGGETFVAEGEAMTFDHVFDARGQSSLTAAELPLPTLRLQILANAVRARIAGHAEAPVDVGPSLALNDSINRLSQVFCLSIPHLLRRQPFVQGLTSSFELSGKIVEAIRASSVAEAPAEDDRAVLGDLIGVLGSTSLIDCLETVVQVPIVDSQDQTGSLAA